MNKRDCLRWIEALESGQFPQTTKVLRRPNGYCCLGVGLEVLCKDKGDWSAPLPGWDDEGNRSYKLEDQLYYWSFKDEVVEDVMEERAAQFLENRLSGELELLGRAVMGLSESAEMELIRMNDDGVPFKEIADYLRAYILPQLPE